jgi:hypothetical protein
MNEIIIHIGHPKTGSSFIQSILALNRNILSNYFTYPTNKDIIKASNGYISSGNFNLLFNKKLNLNSCERYLFSGEQLFISLLSEYFIFFKNLCITHKVKVILYTRDIIEQRISSWGQSIKRGGSIFLLDTSLKRWINQGVFNPYSTVLKWFNAAETLGFELVVRNYSNHRDDLINTFLIDVIGDKTTLPVLSFPDIVDINRSLNMIELEFQRVFNAFDKKSSRYISDLLVNYCPNIKPERIFIESDTYDLILEKCATLINAINNRMLPDEKLIIGERTRFVSENHQNRIFFSDHQLKVLSESLKKEFSTTSILYNSCNNLRDISLKIEAGEILQIEDALILMKIAQLTRPDGPLINRKIMEWEELLTRNK